MSKDTKIELVGGVRNLKAQGLTYEEIGIKLGISKQLAHYYGRARPGENLCGECLQKHKRRVN